MKEKVATTVKIPSELYDELKILGIRHKISLQSLVERCINLFVANTEISASFRETVLSYNKEIPSTAVSEEINEIPITSTSS